MDDLVPHPHDSGPGNVRIGLAEVYWRLRSGLADDLEKSFYRELTQAVSLDFVGGSPLCQTDRFARRVQHALKAGPVLMPRHEAGRIRGRPGFGNRG